MIKNSFINDLAGRIKAILPKDISVIKDDFEKNVKACISSSLDKFNLVTREEFDTQTALLSKLENKLKELEDNVKKMEDK